MAKIDEYNKLIKLLYPTVDATGNLYYGQVRKLTTDQVFNRSDVLSNDFGFESSINTIKVITGVNTFRYDSYFNWKLGPLSGSVKVGPFSSDEQVTSSQFPDASFKEIKEDGSTETIAAPFNGTVFAKYILSILTTPKQETSEDGNNYTVNEKSISSTFDGLYVTKGHFDPVSRIYPASNGHYWISVDSETSASLYIRIATKADSGSSIPEDQKPLTLMATSITSTVCVAIHDNDSNHSLYTYQYRTESSAGSDTFGSWSSVTKESTITLPLNTKVQFRCNHWDNTGSRSSHYSYFVFSGVGTVTVSGNIMSMLCTPDSGSYSGDADWDNSIEDITSSTYSGKFDYAFYYLFTGGTNNIDLYAGNLVMSCTKLTAHCYDRMFSGNQSLKSAPSLAATGMTNLNTSCYESMFEGCERLASSPDLPYVLTSNNCYKNMFKNCTSLVTPPTAIAISTSINPLTDSVATGACESMFEGCESLTTAPLLPVAYNLGSSCYKNMFKGCIALTKAPTLPAENVDSSCYDGMFDSCSGLNEVKCNAKVTDGKVHFTNWLNNSTYSTGTFYKNESAIWDDGSSPDALVTRGLTKGGGTDYPGGGTTEVTDETPSLTVYPSYTDVAFNISTYAADGWILYSGSVYERTKNSKYFKFYNTGNYKYGQGSEVCKYDWVTPELPISTDIPWSNNYSSTGWEDAGTQGFYYRSSNSTNFQYVEVNAEAHDEPLYGSSIKTVSYPFWGGPKEPDLTVKPLYSDIQYSGTGEGGAGDSGWTDSGTTYVKYRSSNSDNFKYYSLVYDRYSNSSAGFNGNTTSYIWQTPWYGYDSIPAGWTVVNKPSSYFTVAVPTPPEPIILTPPDDYFNLIGKSISSDGKCISEELVTTGSNSSVVRDITTSAYNMSDSLVGDSNLNIVNTKDGSLNQEIWGYKQFNGQVAFKNGIFGNTASITATNTATVKYDESTSSATLGPATQLKLNPSSSEDIGLLNEPAVQLAYTTEDSKDISIINLKANDVRINGVSLSDTISTNTEGIIPFIPTESDPDDPLPSIPEVGSLLQLMARGKSTVVEDTRWSEGSASWTYLGMPISLAEGIVYLRSSNSSSTQYARVQGGSVFYGSSIGSIETTSEYASFSSGYRYGEWVYLGAFPFRYYEESGGDDDMPGAPIEREEDLPVYTNSYWYTGSTYLTTYYCAVSPIGAYYSSSKPYSYEGSTELTTWGTLGTSDYNFPCDVTISYSGESYTYSSPQEWGVEQSTSSMYNVYYNSNSSGQLYSDYTHRYYDIYSVPNERILLSTEYGQTEVYYDQPSYSSGSAAWKPVGVFSNSSNHGTNVYYKNYYFDVYCA